MAPVKRRTSIVPPEPPIVRSVSSHTRLVVPAVVALVAFAVVGGLLFKNPFGKKPEATPPVVNEVELLIEKVKKAVVIDTEEAPAVAAVVDADLLRKESPMFYRDAQKGDQLLVWKELVVLYSKEHDRVLAVQPILLAASSTATIESTPVAAKSEIEAKEEATIEVRNGTFTPGLAKQAKDKLAAVSLNVTSIGDAKTKGGEKTRVLNASGKPLPKTLAKIVEALGGEIVTELADEGAAKADILIVIGTEYKP